MKKSKETRKELAKKLGVSISSLYYKHKKPAEDNEVKLQIESVLAKHPSYGHRRIAKSLKLNHKRILRVMKIFGIKPYRRRSKKPFKPDDLNKPPAKHQNLIKNICPIVPNYIWVSDFTYIKYQGKFFYLATIMDLFSREIVGFNISRFHNQELVLGAIEETLKKYSPALIIHSDQGSEYDSIAYENVCTNLGMKISMSKKSSPWENGFQESFYGNFKLDLGDVNRFDEYGKLVEEIYTKLYVYNNERIHTAFGTSPYKFKQNYLQKLKTQPL